MNKGFIKFLYELLGICSLIFGYVGGLFVTWYLMIIQPIMYVASCYHDGTLNSLILFYMVVSILLSGVPGLMILILSHKLYEWCMKKGK